MKILRTLALALGVMVVVTGSAVLQMHAHNDTTEALVVPVVLPDPAPSPQSWSVAIEQNAMVTKCGSTTNIPVAGASDCTTAKAAAWNLLTTLLQTPNCMSSGCPAGSTIGQGVSTCTPDPYTRPNGSPAMRWQVSWTWKCVPPSDNCLTVKSISGCCIGKDNNGPMYSYSYMVNNPFPYACNITVTSANGNVIAYGPTTAPPGNSIIAVTFTDVPPANNPFCLEFQCSGGGKLCKTRVCSDLRPCP